MSVLSAQDVALRWGVSPRTERLRVAMTRLGIAGVIGPETVERVVEEYEAMNDLSVPETNEERQVFCAHRSGIEYVQVTQPQGAKYEWWRCMACHCEFRPTGELRPGDGPGEGRISGVLAKRG